MLSGSRRKGSRMKPIKAGRAREGGRDRFGKSQCCTSVVRPTGLSISKNGRDGQDIFGGFRLAAGRLDSLGEFRSTLGLDASARNPNNSFAIGWISAGPDR